MITPQHVPSPGVPSAAAEIPSTCLPSGKACSCPAWKRILDVTLVLLSMPVVIPVGIVIAAFIKIVSPGPAFFRQKRIGFNGQTFMCLKFRTMKVNADTSVHHQHLKDLMTSNRSTRKLDCAGDKRLIFGGLALRSMGVDELPQLFNVLRGEMSLVGPRPCTPYEFGLYTARHRRRCEAPPGLTGLWQVSGKNKTTFEEMIDLDLRYLKEKSLGQDLKIILLTFPAILLLVWEMKIVPAFTRRGSSPAPVEPETSNATGTPVGTAAARK